VLAAACEADRSTEPRVIPAFGKGGPGGSGDVTVSATDPPGAPQDTTLDVRVFGTNFDRGSRADFALGGVVGPEVKTNSTRFVSSTELIANITIAATADTGRYDVIVTTSRGKKGIGTEMFAIDVADPAIAFVEGGTTNKLLVMNASGTHRTVIATGSSFGHPSWSPDARSIAFGGTIGGSGGIWIIDVAVMNDVPTGSNLRRVPINLPGTSGGPWGPDWSPLGDLIAFIASDTGTAYDRNIYVVPPNGGTAAVVHTSGSCCYPTHPDWSPDGSKLVFMDATSDVGVYQWSLRVLDRTTGVVTTIVPLSDFFVRFPAWSRNGDRVAYSGYPGAGGVPEAIYLVAPAAGDTPVKLLDGRGPAWSPDDGTLVFGAYQPQDVYTYEFSTGVKRRLRAGAAYTAPDWRQF
jgi:Tol biopolymer transport system component